jgi:hypothetical protein
MYAGAAEEFASLGTMSRDDRRDNQASVLAHNRETRV